MVQVLTSHLLVKFFVSCLNCRFRPSLEVWDWSSNQNNEPFQQIKWYIEFWAQNSASKMGPLSSGILFEFFKHVEKIFWKQKHVSIKTANPV